MTRTVHFLLAVIAAVALSAEVAASQQAPPTLADETSVTVRKLVTEAHHPYMRWSDFPFYRDELEALYEPAGFEPFWFESSTPRTPVAAVLDALSASDKQGLNPEDYDAERLVAAVRRAEAGDVSGPELAMIDVALTVSFMRLLSDLHIGRVNPANLSYGINVEPKKYDLPALVRAAAAENRIAETVAEVEPYFRVYAALKKTLAMYRELARADTAAAIPDGSTVHPGDTFEGLGALSARLALLGDLPPTGVNSGEATYGGSVQAAVARFQSRHGLEPDSVIGPATFAELNTPIAHRVRQIELALERTRWLPSFRARRVIIVNIPAFELWAFDSVTTRSHFDLNMSVIVGKSLVESRQTPVFIEDMRYIVFRPYWNIPYKVAVNELLPGALEDPAGYMAKHDYELVTEFAWGATPLPNTRENLERVKSGSVKMRQKPGGSNSLGAAKFIFPNAASVYLHGTPAQQLFSRTRRDFSHGCIRLEDPHALADWVLKTDAAWDGDRIGAAMSAERPERANLAEPFPVVLFYTTVLVDDDGTVLFYDDIYGHDAVLEGALGAGYPYPE